MGVKHLRRNGHGFTLVELLVTLAIVALAVAAVGTINLLNQRDTLENKLLNELQDDMRYTVETLVPYLRMGGDLDVVEDSVTGDVAVTVFIPREVHSEDFDFGFIRSTGTMWVRVSSQPICSKIAEMNVSLPDSNGLVTLELVSVSTMPGVQHALPLTLKTSVMLRNR